MTQQTELERIDLELADVAAQITKYKSRLTQLKIREKTLRGKRQIAVPEAQIRQGKFAFLPGEKVRVKAGYEAWYQIADGDIARIDYASEDDCSAYRVREDSIPPTVEATIPAEFLEAIEIE